MKKVESKNNIRFYIGLVVVFAVISLVLFEIYMQSNINEGKPSYATEKPKQYDKFANYECKDVMEIVKQNPIRFKEEHSERRIYVNKNSRVRGKVIDLSESQGDGIITLQGTLSLSCAIIVPYTGNFDRDNFLRMNMGDTVEADNCKKMTVAAQFGGGVVYEGCSVRYVSRDGYTSR